MRTPLVHQLALTYLQRPEGPPSSIMLSPVRQICFPMQPLMTPGRCDTLIPMGLRVSNARQDEMSAGWVYIMAVSPRACALGPGCLTRSRQS